MRITRGPTKKKKDALIHKVLDPLAGVPVTKSCGRAGVYRAGRCGRLKVGGWLLMGKEEGTGGRALKKNLTGGSRTHHFGRGLYSPFYLVLDAAHTVQDALYRRGVSICMRSVHKRTKSGQSRWPWTQAWMQRFPFPPCETRCYLTCDDTVGSKNTEDLVIEIGVS